MVSGISSAGRCSEPGLRAATSSNDWMPCACCARLRRSSDIALVDDAGIERLYVSRIGLNSTGGGIDRSADAAVSAPARQCMVWPRKLSRRLGAVHDHRGGRQPQGRRRRRRGNQPKAHLGGHFLHSRRPYRPCLRPGSATAGSSPIRTSAGSCEATATRSAARRRSGGSDRRKGGGDHDQGPRWKDRNGGDGADRRRGLDGVRRTAAVRGIRAHSTRLVAYGRSAALRRGELPPPSPSGWRGA